MLRSLPSRALGVVLLSIGATLALSLGACVDAFTIPDAENPTGVTLAAYPPMPNDAPPGASARTIAAAASLGRGVNLGNMLEAPTEGAWGVAVTDDIIDKVAAAGFTSVRLPVRWSNHTSPVAPFVIDPVFVARVELIVDQLLTKGLTVVLNMHHYRQLDGDVLDVGEFAVPDGMRELRFVVIWEQLAARFASRGDRLLFELYNEPHGRLDGEAWNILAARALGAVRRIDVARVVVIGPTQWNSAGALGGLKMPNDSNLIATVHNYSPFAFTHQGAEWVSPVLPTGVTCCSAVQLAEMTSPLATAKAWADARRYPIFVGEFGAYSQADEASRVTFNRAMRDAMESRGMGWHYWEFASGFGVYDPQALTFRTALLASLLGPP